MAVFRPWALALASPITSRTAATCNKNGVTISLSLGLVSQWTSLMNWISKYKTTSLCIKFLTNKRSTYWLEFAGLGFSLVWTTSQWLGIWLMIKLFLFKILKSVKRMQDYPSVGEEDARQGVLCFTLVQGVWRCTLVELSFLSLFLAFFSTALKRRSPSRCTLVELSRCVSPSSSLTCSRKSIWSSSIS